MQTVNNTFRLSMLATALFSAFGAARADDSELAQYVNPESSISLGVGNWNKDRPQQGIYDGMRDQGVYGLFDADITKRYDESGTWLLFKGQNLGLENREFRGDVLRQGDIGGFVEYGKTIRDNPFTFNTGLQGIGSTHLTVGTSGTNANVGAFTKRDVELGTSRELIRLGGFKNLLPGLDFKLDFKNEEKTGTRPMGWGSAALFSVEPIDSTTRQLEAMLQYSGERLQLSGGYYGSWYDNQNSQVLEQLRGLSGGTSASLAAITPISLPLSNEAHQIFVDGGYSFTPSTRGTFKVAYTRATQDEHLPSYTLAAPNNRFINAPSHLDGKIDTTLVQLGLTSRPMPKLSINANFRYYDVDDKTPLSGFVGSNVTGNPTVFNTPHSYTTRTGKLEATYRLPLNFSVTGGVDYSDQDRSYPTMGTVYVPFRADINETTYRIQLRRSLADSLNGTLSYLYSDRDGSSYRAANGTPPYSNQINPIHIADRNRDKWRFALDWEPAESLSLQFRVDHSQDEYPQDGRPFGLRDGSSQLYAIDGSYTFSENWQLSAWYAYDVTKAREVGFRQGTGTPANAIKDADLEEVGDSFGINLRGRVTSRFDIGASFDWFQSKSSYPQELTLTAAGTAFPAGVTGPLPDIKNSLSRLKLDGKYAVDKNSDIRIDFVHERWHTDDWSWTFADGSPFAYYSGTLNCNGCTRVGPGTYTGVVDGTTVNAKKTQSADFLGVRYIYKF
jgi:MtrB/PioB family decaheme-associated outer membrane protein